MRSRDPGSSALLTDLYQLTMLQTYYEHGMTRYGGVRAVLSPAPAEGAQFFCCRGTRAGRRVSGGTGSFCPKSSIGWRARTASPRTPSLGSGTCASPATLDAMPEGTVIFANEPIIRVVAPLPEAQLVETRIMNILHFQTMIASKAARAVTSGARQAPGGFRLASRPRRRSGSVRSPCHLSCRDVWHGDGARGPALRRADLRHHGTLLHPGPRQRDGGVRELRAQPSGEHHVLDRHL